MQTISMMLCALCLFCSCRQRADIAEAKTTTRLAAHTDTVNLRLLVADSIVVRERTLGDTFYKEKEHFRTLVKDHFRQHTDTLVLRDTVSITRRESKGTASGGTSKGFWRVVFVVLSVCAVWLILKKNKG